MKIHPSLLAAETKNIGTEIVSLGKLGFSSLHFDIGDDIFIPSKMLSPSLLKKISKNHRVDVHLMVKKPSTYFSDIVSCPAVKAVAFHIESEEDIRENISLLRRQGKQVGLALLYSTPADFLDPYLLEIDYILIMTIKGGFSGMSFLPDMLPKIAELHNKRPELPILVDGGIDEDTLQLCINQGAAEAVVGRALFSQKNRKKYLKILSKIKKT